MTTDNRTFKDAATLEEATDRVIRDMTRIEVSDAAVSRVMARVRAAAEMPGTDETGGSWLGALIAPRVSWSMVAANAALAALIAAGLTLVAVRGLQPGTTVASATPPNPLAPVVKPLKHAGGTPGVDQPVGASLVLTPDEDPPHAAQAPVAAGAAAAAAAPAAGLQDVKLDVTITDQSGATKPVTKTVSLMVADRDYGKVTSETRIPVPHRPGPVAPGTVVDRWDWETLPLNVTVWPTVMSDGHVRVKLSLNYRSMGASPGSPQAPLSTAVITKDITSVLSDGKPQVISTSADAATDRKVTVELKATIQK